MYIEVSLLISTVYGRFLLNGVEQQETFYTLLSDVRIDE